MAALPHNPPWRGERTVSNRIDFIALKAGLDIVDYASELTELKKAGATFKGCCPLHHEKTPSFSVFPSDQHFHCFGCGKHGSVIDLAMYARNVSLADAIRYVASRSGYVLPDRNRREAPPVPVVPAGLVEAMNWAQRFFRAHRGASDAYRKERGFSDGTADRFQIGGAEASWGQMVDAATRHKVSLDLLEMGGVLGKSPKGRLYDFFRNRMMVPVRNAQGEIISFAGRDMNTPPDEKGDVPAKWINTKNTPLFVKGENLFGIDLAAGHIASTGKAILVEGHGDVMAMHAAGFQNTVGCMMATLSERQAALLAEIADEVVIMLDADDSGRKHAIPSVATAEAAGLRATVGVLPAEEGQKMDPGSVLSMEGGADLVGDAVGQSANPIEEEVRRMAVETRGRPVAERIKMMVATSPNATTQRIAIALGVPEAMVESIRKVKT